MASYDLVVRGGTVVTAGGRSDCDVAITAGRVAQLGGEMHGDTEIDARGLLVLPGGIDLHVHLAARAPTPDDPPGFVDDFESGTRAAVAGGITTVGQMSFPDDDLDGDVRAAVERDSVAAGEQAVCDYVLHPSAFLATPTTLEQLPDLAEQGHRSLKLVTIAFDHDASNLVAAVRAAGELGMLTYVHCEDGAIIDHLGAELVRAGEGGMANYPRSRPDFTEAAAVDRAVAICEATGAPICIVHLSSAAALASARRAQRRGLPVYVETRPIYLHLTDAVHAEPDSGRFVGMPPVRAQHDQDALWHGLVDGSVQTIASDHAPWFLRDKIDPALDVVTSRKGVAELETMLPMIFSAGVRSGRITLERFVALTSTNAARLNGMYPRKGTIAVGSDADLVLLDPDATWTVRGALMESRAGYTVYDGQEVTGQVRYTISRGEVVFRDGAVTAAAGRGRLVPRERTRPL